MFHKLHTDQTDFREAGDELCRKYVRDVQDFWLALHGFLRLRSGNYPAQTEIVMVRMADQRIAAGLVEIVNEWLESGRTNDGREYPYTRRLTSGLRQRCQNYLSAPPVGAGPYVLEFAGCTLSPDREFPELDDVSHRYPAMRKIALDRKRIGERMRTQSALRVGIDVSFPFLQEVDQWGQYIIQEPLRLFLTLLNADGLRFLLVQCRKCRRYDFTKTREEYKRGWHCGECRKTAATLASLHKTRKAMRDEWMKLAFIAQRRYTPSYGEQPVWLADQVNKKLNPAQWVKRNWITRHLDEIESKAKAIQVSSKNF